MNSLKESAIAKPVFHTVINLTLKFICHFGEFIEYKVGDFNKLIGKGYNCGTPTLEK